jgi:cell wall-associated NlpC family hydrolase
MRYIFPALFIALFVLVASFSHKGSNKVVNENKIVTVESPAAQSMETGSLQPIESTRKVEPAESIEHVQTSEQAEAFVEYAKTLIGTPYAYGSVDPSRGLDCSGFVNCVSDRFGIKVPRSSVEFTDYGTTIETTDAQPGDLILFTGTNAGRRVVGHIGIVTDNNDGEIEFIHSSSGKAKGVVVSGLSDHYKDRLLKVIRIFPAGANKVAA